MDEPPVQNFDQLDYIVRENSVFIKQIFLFFVTVSLFLVIAMMIVVLSRLHFQQKQVRALRRADDPVKQAARHQGWTDAGRIARPETVLRQKAGTRVLVTTGKPPRERLTML
ncbi:ORF51 [Betabaculovirus altermyunipunctae]|uniref:ORF51 n=1 Tax=Betabaculovirus altermyunipunctae TaxID=3051996 RepID=A0A1S5YEC8_9BBAC|nr:ORF51 [Betabaculovirus altermyunipunctae]AQQ80318.1 ORF51 [Betabaculovirus altermyunipunctae]